MLPELVCQIFFGWGGPERSMVKGDPLSISTTSPILPLWYRDKTALVIYVERYGPESRT